MIEFPAATAVHKRLPKEAFYKHLPLTKILKEKFVSDVDRIVVENSLTKENLNLASDAEIKEIMLLSISLKSQEFDGKVIEAIARVFFNSRSGKTVNVYCVSSQPPQC